MATQSRRAGYSRERQMEELQYRRKRAATEQMISERIEHYQAASARREAAKTRRRIQQIEREVAEYTAFPPPPPAPLDTQHPEPGVITYGLVPPKGSVPLAVSI